MTSISKRPTQCQIKCHALFGWSLPSTYSLRTHWVIFVLVAEFNSFSYINKYNNYSHTDGIDGKQARRTGTSGPLGELFDHGVDSYSAVLIPIYMFSLFGRTDLTPWHMHFVTWNVFLNFYLSHFEKYNTGVMFLPWAYDVTMWVSTDQIYATLNLTMRTFI